MAVAVISLCILAFIAYSLTRNLYINLKKRKGDRWRVEVHFTLCALHFSKDVARRDADGKGDRSKKKRRSLHHYREIWQRVLDILSYSELEIKSLHIPSGDDEGFTARDATRPWKYHSILLALSALLRSSSKRLTIHDNAIILIPDGDELLVDITAKVRLFHVIRTIIAFVLGEKFMKRGRTAGAAR